MTSEQEPQAEGEGIVGQSESTAGLERHLEEASSFLEKARDDLCRAQRRLSLGKHHAAKGEALSAQVGLEWAAQRIKAGLRYNAPSDRLAEDNERKET